MAFLQISTDGMNESLDGFGNTFRTEGMSVAYDKLRIDGENIQMKVTNEDLIMGKRIGQGACSSVHRAKHKTTGEFYAVKLFNVYDKTQRSQMTKEITMLLEIDCPCLIKLLVCHCAFRNTLLLLSMSISILLTHMYVYACRACITRTGI